MRATKGIRGCDGEPLRRWHGREIEMSAHNRLLACAALVASMGLGVGSASAGTLILTPQSGTITVDQSGSELFAWSVPNPERWTFSDGIAGVFTNTMTGVGPGTTSVMGMGGFDTDELSGLTPKATVFFDLVVSPVPEAAPWLMMLCGVALVGAGLRIRRREARTLA
jgi:hypothetical protein